jgi:Secretion system C-terminal sorting domain
MIAVNNAGSIMIAGTNTTTNNTTWLSFFIFTNSNGIPQKSWTYNENGRPTISVTRDSGFILSVAKTQAGRYDITSNLRLIWLNKNGEFLRSAYYGPQNATSLLTFTPRVLPLPDNSVILSHAIFVSRLAQDGTIMWSQSRNYLATTGVTFRVGTSLIINGLMMSSKNKIYVPSGLVEVNIGVGKEIPVINEYDFDGNMRALTYPNANSRISSITEIPNNGGFFITADTIIQRGAGVTKNIAFRLMRADTLFNAGCGAPILLNSNNFNGDIQLIDPPIVLASTPFATADYSPTTVTTAIIAPIITKGECPNSIVGTNELKLPIINVYPNPSSGDFTIESEDAAIKSVQVFDIAGRLVSKIQSNSARTSLNIEQSGTYFLQIETTNGRLVKKVVRLN